MFLIRERRLPQSDCHFYTKLNGDAIYTSTCVLGLTQCIVFNSVNRGSTLFAGAGVVKPDSCHPPIATEIPVDLHNSTSYQDHSCRNKH